jgi:hypothetical protein
MEYVKIFKLIATRKDSRGSVLQHYPDRVFSKVEERAGDSRRLDFLFLYVFCQDKRKNRIYLNRSV